ncbi:uncharacterized protein LOC125044469 [Penaeus chinensis]|uniref:uncharacterized protein LOC125044469 n=1 Tax=Penaeus chinensis TaxID=139456 RepID=UPI001FB72082|nr:uncharacterized protein LOC125044469 [Penaeus chinensis]
MLSFRCRNTASEVIRGLRLLEFAGEEYQQISGLAMAFPLSAVMACLFMETLERDNYKDIIGRYSTWLRYVDDVLVIVPRRSCLHHILKRLNFVQEKIQFTVKEELEQKLPDSLIHQDDDGLCFSIYRKPTNKDDYIHYYSVHNNKTKSGVVIGFFPRALRICNPEFLEDEVTCIINYFIKHKNHRGFLLNHRKKADNMRGQTLHVKISSSSREKIHGILQERKQPENIPYGPAYRIP